MTPIIIECLFNMRQSQFVEMPNNYLIEVMVGGKALQELALR